jgi:dienelactone hydrolase
MTVSRFYSKLSRFIVKAFLIALIICLSATGSSSNPDPLFKQVNKYQTTISTNGDPADIYYSVTSEPQNFPVALLLQGALIDKADYSNFARVLASYGFVVIVPNHFKSSPKFGVEGFFPEISQIEDTLTYVKTENANLSSPLKGILAPEKLALLGHSYGGAVGLSAIGNYCISFLCDREFTLPKEIVAGVFYGTYLQDFNTKEFLTIENDSIPLGLIQGSRDGVTTLKEIGKSYQLIQDAPKALITVKGANHYSITNKDSSRDPLRPTLDQNIANETIARWSGLFLRASIFNQRDAFDYVYKTGNARDRNVSVINQTH